MKRARNKLWRAQKKKQKYINRLKVLAAHSRCWLLDGVLVRNPLWIDLYNNKATLCYTNTSTPCSCALCRGERYKREKSIEYEYPKKELSMDRINSLANKWANLRESDESLAIDYTLRKVRSIGHLNVPEARQLTELGIPVLHALAYEFGCGVDEAIDYVEDGDISFEDVLSALQGEYERLIMAE